MGADGSRSRFGDQPRSRTLKSLAALCISLRITLELVYCQRRSDMSQADSVILKPCDEPNVKAIV